DLRVRLGAVEAPDGGAQQRTSVRLVDVGGTAGGCAVGGELGQEPVPVGGVPGCGEDVGGGFELEDVRGEAGGDGHESGAAGVGEPGGHETGRAHAFRQWVGQVLERAAQVEG